MQLLATPGNSWQTFAIFAAVADLATDLAAFAARVALATLVALAALATLVACAPLATLMVLQMLLLVVCPIIVYVWQNIGSSNFL